MWGPECLVAGYFGLVSVVILVTKYVGSLNQLLQYGKVALQKKEPEGSLDIVVARVASLTVPKSWFLHFYLVFLVLMWGQMWWVFGASHKYKLIWALLTLQASRRAVESHALTAWGSKSRMHVSHYFVGLLYYVCISGNCLLGLTTGAVDAVGASRVDSVELLLVGIFLVFSVDQWQNHRHLALLVKYSVPTFRFFKVVSCAHYLDEIALYFVITVIALRGNTTSADWNFAASWVFVVVNLSVSALETKQYYMEKFENYDVRYAVIPFAV